MPAARPHRLPQLTALRFFAAMLVFGSHLTFLENGTGHAAGLWRAVLREGGCGVAFFYVLSGFVLSCAYADAFGDGRVSRARYALHRLIRLVPLHWATAAAVAAMLVLIRHEPPRPGTLIPNLAMLHAWSPDPTVHYSLNGPSWSLSCELFFYLLFPALVTLRVARLALLWLALFAAVLSGAVLAAAVAGPWRYSATAEWVFYVLPATRLLDFVTGMLLWHAHRGGLGARRCSTMTEVAVVVLLPVVMAACVAAALPLPLRWQLAYLPVMAALVLVFAHGRGALSRALCHPLPLLLGEASFALYLTHRPLVLAAMRARARIPFGGDDALLAGGLAILCVAFSVAVLWGFDRPSQAILRRLLPVRRRRALAAAALLSMGAAVAAGLPRREPATVPPPSASVGINLFGIAPYNRQPVFANMIAQSEWFSARGGAWGPFPAAQLDARGWVARLRAGEVAPRPLTMPAPPFARMAVRCTFRGAGRLSAGGIARVAAATPGTLDLELTATGAEGDAAWLQLDATDPRDPLRDLDCRDRRVPSDRLYDAGFVAGLRGFAGLRFLDWQRVNDNPASRWAARTLPGDGSQAGPGGVAIEDMVALADAAGADPWFVIPYAADAAYVEGFARLVHDRLAPGRTVYVELGNEIWNDMFAAARQARREGLALGLSGPGDPMRAQMRRYAQKTRAAMAIWTRVFADRPHALVRVASSINVWPEMAALVLDEGDTARFVDALATAPYIQLDLAGRTVADADRIFAAMDGAIDEAIGHALANRAIALRHGKRFIAYEGGQHLVTPDLALARRIQRDARMERVYARYLAAWRARVGDRMTLYASTAPIGEWGAWGLAEYAGQPWSQTPKRRAVRAFLQTAG